MTQGSIYGWDETAIIEIEGLSSLFSTWLDVYKGDKSLVQVYQELFGQFIICLKRQSMSVANAVFAGMSKILAEVESLESLGKSLVYKAWQLWKEGNPASHHDDSQRKSGNQDALVGYLLCLKQLLRLIARGLGLDEAKTVLAHLRTCVTKSNPTAYSIDIDHLTPVQGMVLEILKSIPTILPEIVSELVESLHGFVTLAYNHTPDHSRSNLTYVALSKTAMDLLESFVNEHVKRSDIDSTKLVTNACAALKVPIHLKYDWKIEGKGSPPWTKATMTAMAILEPFVSTGKASEASRETSSEFWDVVVDISKGITTADCNSCDNWLEVPKDQSFDTDAFRNIRKLVIPALGSSSIPDAIRRKYAESVFENSFIHEPHPDDLARPDQELLEGLISEHIGRVQDLPPSPRSELSYLLLDELFTLVSVHDGSPEWIRLAQAAAPYLVLRTGLTLKAYIMDQPLRGRMPQPWSQKEEMFYIIGKLIDLDTEPKAIPAAPGVTSEHKKHLHRLYPLVMKALKAAWRDEEMVDALQEFLDAVGNDFGV